MRTLALLAALLLLALQVQAELLRGTADQVSAQDLSDAKDQDQLEAIYQDMAMSFGGDDRLAQDASDPLKICYCRWRKHCPASEHYSGICKSYLNGFFRKIRCCSLALGNETQAV